MSYFHGGIRQPFRGYDDRSWNARFRASRKKIKAKAILHHLTPLLQAWLSLTLRFSNTSLIFFLHHSEDTWTRVSAISNLPVACSACDFSDFVPGFSFTASCGSPPIHGSLLKLSSLPTSLFQAADPCSSVKSQLRVAL